MLRYTMNALLSVFAMIYTALSLYACSAPAQTAAGAPQRAVPVETGSNIVNILQSKPGISQALQQAVKLYVAANPGEHINVTTVAGESEYRVALRTRLLAGRQTDIFHLSSGQEARELLPHLEDLSALRWISGAAGQAAAPMLLEGGLYGLPYSLEYCGLLANRDIFAAAGIDLASVTGFEGLSEALATLDAMLEEGGLSGDFPELRSVTDFPIQDREYLGRVAAGAALTGEFASPTDLAATRELTFPYGDGAGELFRVLLEFSPRGDWAERDGLSYLSQSEALAAGKTALILSDYAGAAEVLALNPELEGRLALLPVPLPGLGEGFIYTGSSLWWAVGSASPEGAKTSARRFLTWLYQSDSGTAVVAARFGAVSPWLEAGKETGKSLDRQMLSLIGRGRTAPQLWREFPYAWGSGSFAGEFRSWHAGEIEWGELLQRVKESWAYA
jgi:raffinose/stachyose/melibiose transport system substrate-binding protein